jgi:small subunit ribosomal protein S20
MGCLELKIKRKAWQHLARSGLLNSLHNRFGLHFNWPYYLTFMLAFGISPASREVMWLRALKFISDTKMANTASAKKMARKIVRRTLVNTARRSRVRTFIRKVEEAIASGDGVAATAALRIAEPEIMRAVSKGVVHHNTASRKVSRLAQRVKAVALSA